MPPTLRKRSSTSSQASRCLPSGAKATRPTRWACRQKPSDRAEPIPVAPGRAWPALSYAAPLRSRLKGNARMIGAIRPALRRIRAAEGKVFCQRMAVGPLAGTLGKFHQLQPPRDGNDDILDRADKLLCDRLGIELNLQRRSADRDRHVAMSCRARGGPLRHAGGRTRLLLVGRRGRGTTPTRQFQPMHLADDRIAADAPELRSDLAGRKAFRPELAQKFDAFVGPVHETALLSNRTASRIRSRPDSRQVNTTSSGKIRSAARNLAISYSQLPYELTR